MKKRENENLFTIEGNPMEGNQRGEKPNERNRGFAKFQTRHLVMGLATVGLVLFLGGCVASKSTAPQNPAGFLMGLWHGLIVVPVLIVKLFNHDLAIYQAHNVGWLYDLGFVIGATSHVSAGSKAYRSNRKR